MNSKSRVVSYYDQEAEGYQDLYSKAAQEQEYYPANAIRLEMILKMLRRRRVATLLDIGCGSAMPLVRFLQEGIDAIGFDFSEKMVECGRRNLVAHGLNESRCFCADLERLDTLPDRKFDAVVATGVFPHNINDDIAYSNVNAMLESNGVAYIEYRNALMALYSVNQYSVDFFWNEVLHGDDLPDDLMTDCRRFVSDKFGTAIESVGRRREIEFSDILARFHNPLTLNDELRRHGLRVLDIHYYHWHAAPPHLEKKHKDSYWKASLTLEGSMDWRAMFMCSAFVAEVSRSLGS